MKHLKSFVLLGLVLLAAVLGFAQQPADALSSTKAYKVITLTFVVTPSPIAYRAPSRAPKIDVASLLADPYHGVVRVASIGTAFDVPITIAQSTQGNTPVVFKTQLDPTSNYLKLIPGSGGTTFTAAYGSNTYICAFSIFANYPTGTSWKVVDWGFNSAANPVYPIYNTPQVSDLASEIPGGNGGTIATSYLAIQNSGSPGQLDFSGVPNVSQTQCVNLQLLVPTSLPAGNYAAAIQYTLIVS